ncbi:MAG TPA: hypothetical protein VL860_09885 [Planctomycetota bacterium]|nr:hypothetical protein [Planctomycetota bacterium]
MADDCWLHQGGGPAAFTRARSLLVAVVAVLVAIASGGASCWIEPPILPTPPIEPLPPTIEVSEGAVKPPADYDHRLLWDYQRLIDTDLVKSYAGESDYVRDVRFRPADDPQRIATIDLLVAVGKNVPPPAAHVREALLRLLSDLAPADPRTTDQLLAGLDDAAMKVRFRANIRLRDLYSTDVNFDPNETDPEVRNAAIARWKKTVEGALPPEHPPAVIATP